MSMQTPASATGTRRTFAPSNCFAKANLDIIAERKDQNPETKLLALSRMDDGKHAQDV